MSIDSTVHVEYKLYEWEWKRNKDCARNLVKQKGVVYLPDNQLPDKPEYASINLYLENRYEKLILPRLSPFYNFTRTTLSAWIGVILAKKPSVRFSEKPDTETVIDYLMKNTDGAGNDLCQVGKAGLHATCETGGGLFLVNPPTGETNLQQERTGEVAPRILCYDRENILNWESHYFNSRKQLTYLKLREWEVYSDEGQSELIEKHIEYFLRDGVVTYKVTRSEEHLPNYPALEEGEIRKAGKSATSIPAFWFGANDNDEKVDPAPISTIADLNIVHYVMNSRDLVQRYEAGQGQLHIDLGQNPTDGVDAKGNVVSALNKLNPGGVNFGTPMPIVTENGGVVELIQLSTDSLLAQKPKELIDEAIKIGAQMISQDGQFNTATEATMSFGAITSSLSAISRNVSKALQSAVKELAEYVNFDPEFVEFELSQKLITETLDAQKATAFMNMVMQGVMPIEALYKIMQRAGEIPQEWTLEDYMSKIEESQGFINQLGMGSISSNNTITE